MTPIKILAMLDKHIKISYTANLSADTETITFTYTIGGTPYTMQFENISAIKTEQEVKFLIDVIKSNIQYHINEMENKLQ